MKSERAGFDPAAEIPSSGLELIVEPRHKAGEEVFSPQEQATFRIEKTEFVPLHVVKNLETGKTERMTDDEVDMLTLDEEKTEEVLEEVDDDEDRTLEIIEAEERPKRVWEYGFKPGELVRLPQSILERLNKECGAQKFKPHLTGATPEMDKVHIEVFDEHDRNQVAAIQWSMEEFLQLNKAEMREMAHKMPDLIG